MEKCKLNRNLHEDRGSSTAFFPGWLIGYGAGILLGISIGHSSRYTEDYVKQVQQYNQQIAAQLSETTQPVNKLVLDGSDHFTFETTAADGQSETCSGEYAVKQAMAAISGKVTCTETVTITTKEAN